MLWPERPSPEVQEQLTAKLTLRPRVPEIIIKSALSSSKRLSLFKTAVSLEEAGKIQIVALDKTGTITKGEPQVTDMVPAKGISEEELLGYAYALEKKSEHPLAKAIIAISITAKIINVRKISFSSYQNVFR